MTALLPELWAPPQPYASLAPVAVGLALAAVGCVVCAACGSELRLRAEGRKGEAP